MVRRRAADRRRHRLHLQPDPRRRPRGRQLGHLPDVGRDRHGARRHDRRAGAVEAERRAAAAADPDPARAHLVGRRRGRGEDLPQRARPTASRWSGSGPFRLVEGTAGGSTYRLRGQPRLLAAARRTSTGGRSGSSRARTPRSRRSSRARSTSSTTSPRSRSRRSQGRDGIHAQNGVSPYFEEIAFNIGAVDPETGEPIGDGNPALQDPAFRHALGYAIDNDRLVESAYQGAAVPGDTIIPPAYETFRWEPPEDEAFTFDLDQAGELLDEAGYEVGSDGLRTMPDGSAIGTLRLFARAEERALRRRSWSSSRSGSARSASSPRSA